jgi:hypothetical protein
MISYNPTHILDTPGPAQERLIMLGCLFAFCTGPATRGVERGTCREVGSVRMGGIAVGGKRGQ